MNIYYFCEISSAFSLWTSKCLFLASPNLKPCSSSLSIKLSNELAVSPKLNPAPRHGWRNILRVSNAFQRFVPIWVFVLYIQRKWCWLKLPKWVICHYSSKNETANVFIMSLLPCLFLYPHTVIKLLKNSAAFPHFLLQWESECCYYVGKRGAGNVFPKWNVGLSLQWCISRNFC